MTDFIVSREEKNLSSTQKSRVAAVSHGSHNAPRQSQASYCRDNVKYDTTGTGKSIYVIPCELTFVKKTRPLDKFGIKRSSQFLDSPWGSGNVSSFLSTPEKEDSATKTNPCRSPATFGRSFKNSEELEKCDVGDPNFLHTFGRYVTGNVVDIRTNKNQVIRGVICGFHQGVNFSVDKPVIIDQLQKISKKLPSPLVLNRDDIVEIHAPDIDKDEVIQNNMSVPDASSTTSSVLRTDAEIASESFRARPNGGDAPDDGLQFKPFYEAGNEPKDADGFELNGEGGWNAKQMFLKNESLGVSSSYDPTLTDYTTELRKEDTAEYREREARASALAAEIESSSESRSMANCENDDGEDNDDEEAQFSAVQRQPSGPSYQYGRGNGRNMHSERSLSRGGGSQSMRSSGRGQSYRSVVESSGGMNSGHKSGGPNPPNSRGSRDALIRFSNNFRLAKSGPGAGGPIPQGSNASTGPRKSDAGPLKSGGRGKRVYNQVQSSTLPVSSGRGKHHEDSLEVVSPSDSKTESGCGRRDSDVERTRREDVQTEEDKSDVLDPTPKAAPAPTPPISTNKNKPNDTEEIAVTVEATGDVSVSKDASPVTNEAGDQVADVEGGKMSIKSSLNVDAQPFYPTSWSSPASVPSNIPVQSPPAPLTAVMGGMNLTQPRGPHPAPIHHQTIGAHPYQQVPAPPIAAPLQSQPMQISTLQSSGSVGPDVSAQSQNPHGPTILIHPGGGQRYPTVPPGHTVPHPNHPSGIPGPYQVQHPLSGAHGSVSQGISMAPHGQPQIQSSAHNRNGNGVPKQRSAVVSVQSGGPMMNRSGNPEAQAAAMTGTPLVAPNPHAGQPVHPTTPHAPYHTAQRMEWPQGYNPYGAVSTAQIGQQPSRDGAGSQPGANISNPPTPSSTPQQTPTFLTQPAVAQMGHAPQYVYPQQMAQVGPAAIHQSAFSQQNVAAGLAAHQYPHHGPHITAAGQAIGPNNSAMMAPPGALMLYQATLGHPHQGGSVSHQPGQPHQAHHQGQQQQHVPNPMHMVIQPMYQTHPTHAAPQHPAHMQQHHTQQQHQHQHQQHAAAALQQVMQQAGGPLPQFQQGAHAHHPHSLHNLPYAQGPSAAQYMTQSQHAGHTIPQHAPQ